MVFALSGRPCVAAHRGKGKAPSDAGDSAGAYQVTRLRLAIGASSPLTALPACIFHPATWLGRDLTVGEVIVHRQYPDRSPVIG